MILNEEQVKALSLILDYVQENEHDNYYKEYHDKPENHIYYHAMILVNLFNKG